MAERSRPVFLSDAIEYHAVRGGVARYFRKIVEGVVAAFGRDAVICSAERLDYGAARHIPTWRFRGSTRLRVQDVIASVAAHWVKPALFYSSYYGNARSAAPQVFTVYDMIHERVYGSGPHGSRPARRFLQEKSCCLERAAALLAISEATARDIVAHYPSIDAAKIVVTPLGVDEVFFEAAGRQPVPAGKPYLLYVGNRGGTKNFVRLLDAFGWSGLAREFELRVITPIGTGFTPAERERIAELGLQGSVRLITAADEPTLRASYAGAVAFVYPSEYEGFGLPILEAMASGTLVATSNVSSMPEVGGDVALYFDPYDAEAMAECLRRVVELPAEERQRRIARGIARARTFTWTRCQRRTVDLFRAFL